MAPDGWFHRRPQIQNHNEAPRAKEIPEGLWEKCPRCGEGLLRKEWERNLKVCRKCDYHFRLSAHERIEMLADPGSFMEIAAGLASLDPLGFPEYTEKLAKGQATTGLTDAMVVGRATIGGWPVVLGVSDFRFMGGSMGSVYGERVVRAFERALHERIPVIMVCASGGARMQEGIVALMQMAKTSATVARLHQARIPYITVITDPTTGGVLASFASLGDIILAEPGALMRFAGDRVAQQAGPSEKPPDNFQRAEFYQEHGTVDLIVHRKDLRSTLVTLLRFCCQGRVKPQDVGAFAAAK